jgi:hypothetical protein
VELFQKVLYLHILFDKLEVREKSVETEQSIKVLRNEMVIVQDDSMMRHKDPALGLDISFLYLCRDHCELEDWKAKVEHKSKVVWTDCHLLSPSPCRMEMQALMTILQEWTIESNSSLVLAFSHRERELLWSVDTCKDVVLRFFSWGSI